LVWTVFARHHKMIRELQPPLGASRDQPVYKPTWKLFYYLLFLQDVVKRRAWVLHCTILKSYDTELLALIKCFDFVGPKVILQSKLANPRKGRPGRTLFFKSFSSAQQKNVSAPLLPSKTRLQLVLQHRHLHSSSLHSPSPRISPVGSHPLVSLDYLRSSLNTHKGVAVECQRSGFLGDESKVPQRVWLKDIKNLYIQKLTDPGKSLLNVCISIMKRRSILLVFMVGKIADIGGSCRGTSKSRAPGACTSPSLCFLFSAICRLLSLWLSLMSEWWPRAKRTMNRISRDPLLARPGDFFAVRLATLSVPLPSPAEKIWRP